VNVTNVHVSKNLEKLQYRRGLGRIGFTRISWCICAGDAFPDTDRSQPLPLALQAHHSPELLYIYLFNIAHFLHFKKIDQNYYLWLCRQPQPRIIIYLFNIANFLHFKKIDQNYFLWLYRKPQPRIIRYLINIVHFLHCKKTDQNYFIWLYRQPQPRIIRYLFNIVHFLHC
jgi:hypothetical protein